MLTPSPPHLALPPVAAQAVQLATSLQHLGHLQGFAADRAAQAGPVEDPRPGDRPLQGEDTAPTPGAALPRRGLARGRCGGERPTHLHLADICPRWEAGGLGGTRYSFGNVIKLH